MKIQQAAVISFMSWAIALAILYGFTQWLIKEVHNQDKKDDAYMSECMAEGNKSWECRAMLSGCSDKDLQRQ